MLNFIANNLTCLCDIFVHINLETVNHTFAFLLCLLISRLHNIIHINTVHFFVLLCCCVDFVTVYTRHVRCRRCCCRRRHQAPATQHKIKLFVVLLHGCFTYIQISSLLHTRYPLITNQERSFTAMDQTTLTF